MTMSTIPQSTSNTNSVEVSWSDMMSGTLPESPYRSAFRQAVAEMAASAKRALPDCSSRIDTAVKIVLAGDVKLLEDGTARVASQSNGTTRYFVVNGECECKDHPKAPHGGWCKHRLAHALVKRASDEARKRLNGQANGQAETNGHTLQASTPEAPIPAPGLPWSFPIRRPARHSHRCRKRRRRSTWKCWYEAGGCA